MNTKAIMTVSAVILGIAGIALTFFPDTILSYLDLDTNKANLLIIQIPGARYFAFRMLNRMTRTSLIG